MGRPRRGGGGRKQRDGAVGRRGGGGGRGCGRGSPLRASAAFGPRKSEYALKIISPFQPCWCLANALGGHGPALAPAEGPEWQEPGIGAVAHILRSTQQACSASCWQPASKPCWCLANALGGHGPALAPAEGPEWQEPGIGAVAHILRLYTVMAHCNFLTGGPEKARHLAPTSSPPLPPHICRAPPARARSPRRLHAVPVVFTRAMELSCVSTSSRLAQHTPSAQSTAIAYWKSMVAGAGEMAQVAPPSTVW